MIIGHCRTAVHTRVALEARLDWVGLRGPGGREGRKALSCVMGGCGQIFRQRVAAPGVEPAFAIRAHVPASICTLYNTKISKML